MASTEKQKSLKELYRRVKATQKQAMDVHAELESIQSAYLSLAKTCDHKYANGRSAIKTFKCKDGCDHDHKSCAICHRGFDESGPPIMAIPLFGDGSTGKPMVMPAALAKAVKSILGEIAEEIGELPEAPTAPPDSGRSFSE